jgi:hypothetical protein
VSRSSRIRSRLAGLFDRLRELRRTGIDGPDLFKSFLFYIAMGLLNGATLVVIVRSFPEGTDCPIWAVIAANAVAWLVGFFALFAPGGLIVREACLASLLAPWMTPGHAITIALAWRLIQIIAESGCFAIIVATGLPDTLRVAPGTRQSRRGSPFGRTSVDSNNRMPVKRTADTRCRD